MLGGGGGLIERHIWSPPDREKRERWETTRQKRERVGDYQTKGRVVGDYQTEKGERVGDYQTEKGERVGDCGLPGSWRADALSWSVVHCIAHLVARI